MNLNRYMKKNILITNDDGISSSGLLAVNEAVKDLGKTIIIAPSKQRSGIGHAITFMEPVRIDKVKLINGDIGYSISGTPSDSVLLGVYEILDEKPDLVISGINIGYNIGKAELTTSGTLGAAIETASYGIPTIAVSQSVDDSYKYYENGYGDVDFSFAIKILNKIAKKVLKSGLPEGVDLLNLNIPSNPRTEDIKIAKLTPRMYSPYVTSKLDPRGKPYYWIDGNPIENDEEGTDGYYIKKEQVSTLTPLTLDFAKNFKLPIEYYITFSEFKNYTLEDIIASISMFGLAMNQDYSMQTWYEYTEKILGKEMAQKIIQYRDEGFPFYNATTVSYTHLTLPTNREV